MSDPYSSPHSSQEPYLGKEPSSSPPGHPYSGQPGYPYSGPPGYPPAPGGYPPYPQSRGTNGMAIAALVVSCASLVTCTLLGAVGAILGHMARKQIQESGEEGDGMALAGIILGWILTGLTVLAILAFIALIAFGAAANP